MTETKTTKSISKIFISGSIQDVWRELTKTGEAQRCFFNNVMHTTGLRPGAMIQMRSISNKYVGVVGEILEVDPPHRFAMTFKFTNFDDPYCKVIHQLKEVEGGVEYTLISEDIPVGTKTEKQMKAGGDMIVKVLKDTIEQGKPSFGIRLLHVLFKVLEPFSPKQCKVENWPLVDKPSSERARVYR
jgi:uncharacterized protein YndB with AHSA1/START domain